MLASVLIETLTGLPDGSKVSGGEGAGGFGEIWVEIPGEGHFLVDDGYAD